MQSRARIISNPGGSFWSLVEDVFDENRLVMESVSQSRGMNFRVF